MTTNSARVLPYLWIYWYLKWVSTLARKMFKLQISIYFHAMYLTVASLCRFQVELIIEYNFWHIFHTCFFLLFTKLELNIFFFGWMHICPIACGSCRFFMCFIKKKRLERVYVFSSFGLSLVPSKSLQANRFSLVSSKSLQANRFSRGHSADGGDANSSRCIELQWQNSTIWDTIFEENRLFIHQELTIVYWWCSN